MQDNNATHPGGMPYERDKGFEKDHESLMVFGHPWQDASWEERKFLRKASSGLKKQHTEGGEPGAGGKPSEHQE